jgi:YVTN family beta-propeller protein
MILTISRGGSVRKSALPVLVAAVASMCSGQWLETTIQLDSVCRPLAVCYNSQNNKVYCADPGLVAVTVIAGDTNRVIATVPVDSGPSALCYNQISNKIYCANYGSYLREDSTVSIIHGTTDSVIATLVVGRRPGALCYNPDGNKVYCANYSSNNVMVIDGSTDSVVATVVTGAGPRALCYNPTDHKIYCANRADSSVTIIDGIGDTVVATILVRRGPCALCYNSLNDKVYCTDSARNTVTVISGADDAVIATVPTGTMPRSLCYNPLNNKIYCAAWSSNQVTVIDGGTDSVLLTLQLTRDEPMACCYDAQNNKIYVAGRGDWGMNAGVSVIDGASNDTILSIPTDYGSRDLCVNSVQNRVYVANYDSPTISVIRDSITTGTDDSPKPQALARRSEPTVLSASSIQNLKSGFVFDAMGRRVVRPRSGVYFLREEPQATGGKPQAVRKVVVTK